jgi:hypothetical protein
MRKLISPLHLSTGVKLYALKRRFRNPDMVSSSQTATKYDRHAGVGKQPGKASASGVLVSNPFYVSYIMPLTVPVSPYNIVEKSSSLTGSVKKYHAGT